MEQSMRFFLRIVLTAGVVLVPICAHARARDDVMSGAFRCAGIGDSSQWLDCYYGAAQPVRAQIGLAPALSNQMRLAMSPPVGGVVRDERARDEVMAEAVRCISISDERQWLDCYYGAARTMRARLGLSVPTEGVAKSVPVQSATPAPVAITGPVVRAGPPPMPRRRGLFAGFLGDIPPVVKNIVMKSYEFDRKGAFTVTLVDGQVWEQLEEDQVYHPARWRRPASAMLVTISPDVMHTYSMSIEGEKGFYKVHRTH